jgi:hypothetical protein
VKHVNILNPTQLRQHLNEARAAQQAIWRMQEQVLLSHFRSCLSDGLCGRQHRLLTSRDQLVSQQTSVRQRLVGDRLSLDVVDANDQDGHRLSELSEQMLTRLHELLRAVPADKPVDVLPFVVVSVDAFIVTIQLLLELWLHAPEADNG